MKTYLAENKYYQVCMDYLYPKRCPICDGILLSSQIICLECIGRVELVEGKRCIKCSKSFDDYEHETCYDCRKQIHEFEYGLALFEYHSIVDSLFRFKYNGRCEYAEFYGAMMVQVFEKRILHMQPDCIIPIPLHEKKLQVRGYNQAELIAKEVGARLGVPVITDLVVRVRNTKPQKLLSGIKRQNNLKKAFHIAQNDVKLDTVVLIDDIYTTGNTINEVARELKNINVQNIYFITVAIGKGF